MMLSRHQNTLRLYICWALILCTSGEVVEPLVDAATPLLSLSEAETRLPCRYDGDSKVVQVSWSRITSSGEEQHIIMYHFTEGLKEFTDFVNKMRFDSLEPTKDATLLILSTAESDDATYICKTTTFPSGNTDTRIKLTVWSRPISNIEPVQLIEGQTFRAAATCRSVGWPQPRLTWSTDVAGQGQNRSVDARTVSSVFSLHPLRSLDGRQLDCLVWHPTFTQPQRIANRIVVLYPPDVSIDHKAKGSEWYAGLEDAQLKCVSRGNPKPHNITWSRVGAALPEGAETTPDGFLKIGRPLEQSDAGVYQCIASNTVGSSRAEVEITVSDSQTGPPAEANTLLMIIIGAVAGALVLILLIVVISVNRYHRRKNKKLTKELDERKEEISTLSRQASFRRMNSVSTDRYQMDELMPLRVEGTLRNSLSSLERPRSRDSRSTLGGLDALGRPVIYNTSRRGRESRTSRDLEREREEQRNRVESYVRNSTVNMFHPPLHPSPIVMDQTAEIVKPVNGIATMPTVVAVETGGGRSRSVGSLHRSPIAPPLMSAYPPLTDEDEEDEDEEEEEEEMRRLDHQREQEFLHVVRTNGDTHTLSPHTHPHGDTHTLPPHTHPHGTLESHGSETSSQLSEALSSPYERGSVGTGSMRNKTRPNGSTLPPPMPLLHKAQIV
ncbi:nectin-4 [Engraulis encrasicolus]|uniref:nectin-4 n=1 Tax=Engraulis encrasicolus TaxID=184585 RepID=UPI002FD72AA8